MAIHDTLQVHVYNSVSCSLCVEALYTVMELQETCASKNKRNYVFISTHFSKYVFIPYIIYRQKWDVQNLFLSFTQFTCGGYLQISQMMFLYLVLYINIIHSIDLCDFQIHNICLSCIQPWANEAERLKVLEEKHSRGDDARRVRALNRPKSAGNSNFHSQDCFQIYLY